MNKPKGLNPAIRDIKPDDLHPTYQAFASLVGIENALIIGREMGGTQIYLPKLNIEQLVLRLDVDRKIVEEFNGHNHAELARKYKMADRTIYKILERETALMRERNAHNTYPSEEA